MQDEMDRAISLARREYAGAYQAMNWLSPAAARAAEALREELISDILGRAMTPAEWIFAGTKLFTRALSPGCALCGQGKWSCLFINGVCNAKCFYCPSEQKDPGLPMTSSITFERARDYADYVNRFGIAGVGFSGGEPLMSFDRIVDYLRALNEKVTTSLHTWMYTNGILVTEDRLKRLRDLGLKEIRFDLSANDYSLQGLQKAVGIIPTVTVEIPAVPEDLERIKSLLPVLQDAGVNFLNLHQIRCTQFNLPKLIARGYTFLHGPGVSVLETELTALEIIRHSLDREIPLPINYCSFTFRNQFQKAAARKRNALLVKADWEDITETGFIRTLAVTGPPGKIGSMARAFESSSATGWQVSEKGNRLLFPARLWHLVDFSGLTLDVRYSATALRPAASHRYPHTEIPLNAETSVVIERDNRHPGVRMEGEGIHAFFRQFLTRETGVLHTGGTGLPLMQSAEISRYEAFFHGLFPYF